MQTPEQVWGQYNFTPTTNYQFRLEDRILFSYRGAGLFEGTIVEITPGGHVKIKSTTPGIEYWLPQHEVQVREILDSKVVAS